MFSEMLLRAFLQRFIYLFRAMKKSSSFNSLDCNCTRITDISDRSVHAQHVLSNSPSLVQHIVQQLHTEKDVLSAAVSTTWTGSLAATPEICVHLEHPRLLHQSLLARPQRVKVWRCPMITAITLHGFWHSR